MLKCLAGVYISGGSLRCVKTESFEQVSNCAEIQHSLAA